jgi:hypothetical protein|nr:MAG TPA: hypothetical protein [Caudoviricetes sp.]
MSEENDAAPNVVQEEPGQNEEQKRAEEDSKIREIVVSIIGDEKETKKFERTLNNLREKIGLLPLERRDYTPKSELEEIIYNMRWNPAALSECDLHYLHEREMILCSHIAWVKGRENQWMSSYKIESRSFDRAVFQASRFCKARSVDERRAEAISRSPELQQRLRILEIYKLYADHCNNISETFVQMDNSLKKLIDTRRIEFETSRRQQ